MPSLLPRRLLEDPIYRLEVRMLGPLHLFIRWVCVLNALCWVGLAIATFVLPAQADLNPFLLFLSLAAPWGLLILNYFGPTPLLAGCLIEERTRGTAESLILSPVPPGSVITAKVAARITPLVLLNFFAGAAVVCILVVGLCRDGIHRAEAVNILLAFVCMLLSWPIIFLFGIAIAVRTVVVSRNLAVGSFGAAASLLFILPGVSLVIGIVSMSLSFDYQLDDNAVLLMISGILALLLLGAVGFLRHSHRNAAKHFEEILLDEGAAR